VKYGGKLWTGQGPVEGCCEYGNETAGSIKSK